MRLIISGGGTGGHVYPALAVVQSLTRLCAEANIQPKLLWVGSVGGMEQSLVEHAGLEIELIPAAGLRGKGPMGTVKSLRALIQGYRRSQQIVRWFEPDVLFVTGGYVCVPMTLAARQAKIPIMIYLPDLEPGMAIKFLARFADRVAVTTAETTKFFKAGQAVVTGYPVREALSMPPENAKESAREDMALDQTLPTLLVFGGSQGARSINRALTNQLEAYLKVCQVIHITGKLDIDWVAARRDELPAALRTRYHVWAYLHSESMTTALLAADLVISRAGASILGEYPVLGLPAILAPYPYAGTHQALNAAYLARHQAAVVIDDANLNEELGDVAVNLLVEEQKRLSMSRASKKLAKPDAAMHLAREILEVKRYGN